MRILWYNHIVNISSLLKRGRCKQMVNFKADYFQKVIDALAEHTLAPYRVVIYGSVLVIGYLMNYVDEYPAKKLEHGIFLDFKLMGLEKISRIAYREYQKLGTGKLVQRIENGADAGKGVIFDFWFAVIRNLFPTVLFSILFIWKIDKRITIILYYGWKRCLQIRNFCVTIYPLTKKD